MTWSNTLFYLAFGSQIFLLSYYIPNRLIGCMDHVLTNYPPETHPKLYPAPVADYVRANRRFANACQCVLVLGVLLILALLFLVDHATLEDNGSISKAWPAGYGILQFLPLMALGMSEFSYLKQMRRANQSSRRYAELRPRKLGDYVHPSLPAAAIAMFGVSVFIDFYVHDFAPDWTSDGARRALVMLVTNVFMACVGAWTLYGPKQDPHQSADDRAQRISVALKSLCFVSMAVSVFAAATAVDEIFGLGPVGALIVSIYFQVVAMLSLGYTLGKARSRPQNFDVYRLT